MATGDDLRDTGEEIPGTLLQAESTVSVQRVNQSNWSKAVAAGLPILAALFAFLGQMPPIPRAVVCAVGIIAGAVIYDRSKNRQFQMQLALVNKAASKELNSVEIQPKPTEAG